VGKTAHCRLCGWWPTTVSLVADTEVPLQAAVGHVGRATVPCPLGVPGVPVVFPGEQLSTSSLQILQATLAGDGVVTGGQDSTLQTVRVVAQHR
jgi:arginine/lysine/ornithine decarboxylase